MFVVQKTSLSVDTNYRSMELARNKIKKQIKKKRKERKTEKKKKKENEKTKENILITRWRLAWTLEDEASWRVIEEG